MKKMVLILLVVAFAAAQNATLKSVEKINLSVEESIAGWTRDGEPVPDFPSQNGFWQLHDQLVPVRVEISGERDPLLNLSWRHGNKEARFSDRWQYDMAMPFFKPSADGSLLLSVDIGNRLRLIDSEGTIRAVFSIENDYSYNSENIIMAAADEDIQTILTGVTQFEDGQPVSTLSLRTRENEIIFTQTFAGHYLRSLEVNPDGTQWGACIYTADPFVFNTFAADREGNVLAKSQQRSRRILFNDSGEVVFFDKNALQIFSLVNGQKSGSYRLSDPQKIITDAAFEKQNGMLVVQESAVLRNTGSKNYPWKFSDIEISALDLSANEIARQSVKDVTVLQPSLWFDAEKRAFFMGHTKGAEWLRVEVQ